MAACVGSPSFATSAAAPAVSGARPRLEAELADQLAALRQGVDVAVHGLERLQRGALGRQKMVHDALEMLAHDVEAGFRHQVMDVGDAAGDRVVDGDHRLRGAALADGGEGILEGVAGQRRHVGAGGAAGKIAVGAGLALEGDGVLGIGHLGSE
jgi:hypothetical protein